MYLCVVTYDKVKEKREAKAVIRETTIFFSILPPLLLTIYLWLVNHTFFGDEGDACMCTLVVS